MIENYNKNEITLRIAGAQQIYLLSAIRRELDKIHRSYSNLKFEELIPCNCSQCDGSPDPHLYKLSDLERRLDKKRYEVECEKSYEQVNVQRLIFNINGPQHPDLDSLGSIPPGPPLPKEALPQSININIQQQSQDQRNMATFNQNNYDNAKGYQAEAKEGATVNQAETINNHITHNPEPKPPPKPPKKSPTCFDSSTKRMNLLAIAIASNTSARPSPPAASNASPKSSRPEAKPPSKKSPAAKPSSPSSKPSANRKPASAKPRNPNPSPARHSLG
ncbi:MAG: hypothetical protein HC824_09770 [Synechococcales cyanobacterium RM1_1_8]|nr:hypothetical protein [Synechococcales cyanobacterium RM1_1_8]